MDDPHVSPKVGLALAGGASRGFAHLGILDFFQEHRLFISALSGSSMGALVASLYSLGRSPDEIQNQARGFSFRQVFKLTWPKIGFSRLDRLIVFIRGLVGEATFEETQIPLKIIAADLDSSETVIFDSGPIWPALVASICVPVLFEPFCRQGRRLVDGGILLLNPTTCFENMDVVIGTELGLARLREGPIKGLRDYIAQSIELLAKSQRQISSDRADLVIAPRVLRWPFFDFSDPATLRLRGYQACREKEKELQEIFASPALMQKSANG